MMERRLRLRQILAALATILAGSTLAAAAIAVGGGETLTAMPSGICPPAC